MDVYRSGAQRLQNHEEIAVVDDFQNIRDILRGMLKNNGYGSVHGFESGKQALRWIESHSPVNLVITDWNMPNMTGIELLQHIKSDPKHFSVPVIMISDERTDDKVMYAAEEGVDGFLVEPFTENVLIKSIKLALAKNRQRDPLGEKIAELRRLRLSGKYQEALTLGFEILKARNDHRVALMVCECLYHVEEYDKAISLMTDTDEERKSSQGANLRGKIYMKLGQHEEGLCALAEAVKLSPLNHDRKMDLASAYATMGNMAEAEKIIETVVKTNPTDLNLVSVAALYLDQGDIESAGKYLRQTVDPIRDTVPVFNNYAIALRKEEKFEEAAGIYLKCLKINPDSDVLYHNLALLYTKMHKYEEAKETLSNALKVNPDNRHARELRQRIEQVLKAG